MGSSKVLFTYQDSSSVTSNSTGNADSISKSNPAEGDSENVSESPKTAYLGELNKQVKLCEERWYEEKCDLFFLCSDGEVPAHRMVIFNISKYIMQLQDGVPSWYPVYISVPDFSIKLVQPLVQLAYTGVMKTPVGTTMDELFDVMHTLGWVHSDCLTCQIVDEDKESPKPLSPSPKKPEEKPKKGRDGKPKAPLATKDYSSDDDVEMTIDLPDVPGSDDEAKETKTDELTTRGRRSVRKQAATAETTPARAKKTVAPVTGRQNPRKKVAATASPTPESTTTNNEETTEDKNISTAVTPSEKEKPKRGGRKPAVASTKTDTIEEEEEVAVKPVEVEEVRSRTRTIRKPKKFDDDMIVFTPTKKKESPVKASPIKTPATAATKSVVKSIEIEKDEPTGKSEAGKAKGNSKTVNVKTNSNVNESIVSAATKLFTKAAKEAKAKDDDSEADIVQNNGESSKPSATTGRVSRKSSRGEEKVNDTIENDVEDANNESKVSNNEDVSSSGTSKRRASVRSSKSDKEGTPAAVTNNDAVNHDERENTSSSNNSTPLPTSTRRKRSLENSTDEKETTDGVEEEKGTNSSPAKRGARKASTLSNASKSSKTGDSVVGEELGNGDIVADNASKPKRSRQEENEEDKQVN